MGEAVINLIGADDYCVQAGGWLKWLARSF